MENNNRQKGFSLVELLLVVVIVGLLATIAVPSLIRSRDSAEEVSAISTLRMINLRQTGYFFRVGRYGSLREINQSGDTPLGTVSGNSMSKGGYLYYQFPMGSSTPTTRFTVIALKFGDGRIISALHIDQTGEISTLIG